MLGFDTVEIQNELTAGIAYCRGEHCIKTKLWLRVPTYKLDVKNRLKNVVEDWKKKRLMIVKRGWKLITG
jgi:hypothetical protein